MFAGRLFEAFQVQGIVKKARTTVVAALYDVLWDARKVNPGEACHRVDFLQVESVRLEHLILRISYTINITLIPVFSPCIHCGKRSIRLMRTTGAQDWGGL